MSHQVCSPFLVFGSQSCAKVVAVLVAAVEGDLSEEGLYRKPGVKSHIEKLCVEIPRLIRSESGGPVKLVGYVLARVLLTCHAHAPSPLLTFGRNMVRSSHG
jgi:hypothetical protein